MLRYLYLIIILFAFNSGVCFAAKPANRAVHKAVLKTDSSTVKVRTLDSAVLKAYSKQPEFKYDDTDTGPSLWTRFWRWFWHWLSHLFDFLTIHPHASSSFLIFFLTFLKYLFIVLGLATIAFFIFK